MLEDCKYFPPVVRQGTMGKASLSVIADWQLQKLSITVSSSPSSGLGVVVDSVVKAVNHSFLLLDVNNLRLLSHWDKLTTAPLLYKINLVRFPGIVPSLSPHRRSVYCRRVFLSITSSCLSYPTQVKPMTYRLDSFNFLCAEFVGLNPEMYPMTTISLILLATQTKEIKKEITQGPQFLHRVFFPASYLILDLSVDISKFTHTLIFF